MSKQSTSVRRSASVPTCCEFLAAVRLLDGRRELYRIPNAVDAEDARQVVLNQLFEVANVVVSPRYFHA